MDSRRARTVGVTLTTRAKARSSSSAFISWFDNLDRSPIASARSSSSILAWKRSPSRSAEGVARLADALSNLRRPRNGIKPRLSRAHGRWASAGRRLTARNLSEPVDNWPFTLLLGSTSCGNRPVRRANPSRDISVTWVTLHSDPLRHDSYHRTFETVGRFN